MDTFIPWGQSNGKGRLSVPQPWSHPTLKPQVFRPTFPGEGWRTMREHTTDGISNPFGSIWPRFATAHMAARGVATRILAGCVGATGFVANGSDGIAWAVGRSAYRGLIDAVEDSGITSATAMHLIQGEIEGQLVYRSSLEDEYYDAVLASYAGLQAEFGFTVPLIVWQTGNIGGPSGELLTGQLSLNAIRRAQARLWDEPNVFPGVVTCDIDIRPDRIHFTRSTDAELLAARAWHCTNVACFGGAGGRGPRVGAPELTAPRLVEVPLTVANGGLRLGARPARGWRVTGEDGAAIRPSGATLSGTTVELRLPTAPRLPCTLSWGLDSDAAGATTLDAAGLPPEPSEVAVAA